MVPLDGVEVVIVDVGRETMTGHVCTDDVAVQVWCYSLETLPHLRTPVSGPKLLLGRLMMSSYFRR